MYPNLIIGNLIIPSWYALLFTGVFVSTILAIYARPAKFPLNRIEILIVSAILVISGLLGARVLFILLHWKTMKFAISGIFSIYGGYAYFGALIFCILVLWAYSVLRRINFLALLDYSMPFLILSQVFVRIGCLLAGCCYGKPTGKSFGFIFKPVDGLLRHPTQAYEALVLLSVYIIGRLIYRKKGRRYGYTFSITLILYGLGRFFVEYLRTDSPMIFLNLTLAQIACLSLVLTALAFYPLKR